MRGYISSHAWEETVEGNFDQREMARSEFLIYFIHHGVLQCTYMELPWKCTFSIATPVT